MSRDVRSVAETIAQAAGWSLRDPDGEGVCRFLLEDGLDLDIRCLDDRHCVLSAVLEPAPAADAPDARERWLRLGAAACAVLRAQGSVLAKDGDDIVLYRRLDLDGMGDADIVGQARDFLNDQAWWRGQLSGQAQGTPFFPAGMAGWFPAQFSL